MVGKRFGTLVVTSYSHNNKCQNEDIKKRQLFLEAVGNFRSAKGDFWGGPPYTEEEYEAGNKAIKNK